MQKFQAIVGKKSNQPDINWTEFNFPPLLRLFHFRMSEIQDPHRPVVRLLYISYLLILAYTLFNLLDSFIQAGEGYPSIRILYAFANFFVFNGIQMYVFYRGYRGLCQDEGLLKIYKILHLIAGLLWLVFSIIDALAWNGFVRAANFDKDGYGGFVFLSVVESLLLLFGFLLMPVCVYKVHTFIADAGIPSAPGL